LFPFLAVLICTMGSLIVLLVLFVQQAKVYAQSLIASEQTKTKATAAKDAERLTAEREEHQWRQQVLEQQRAEKTEELSDAVDRLSHLDDHIRRLKSRAAELMKLAQDIDLGKQLKDDQRQAAREELERLRKEIERKKKEAAETKMKLANAQRWFAIIPYEGPNGTRRRPIYIECTEAGIILQPEGVTLMPSDFNGPLGPGNPLDAALRTKREYLQRAGETATPYPLLVVRPDGVVAYSVSRAAMKSWDDEFGYELVDGEKRLTFGDPDPQLVSLMQSTVRTARQKQAALAAAMPRKFQSDDPLTSFHPDEALPDAGSFPPGPGRGAGAGTGTGGAGTSSTGRGVGGGGAGVNTGSGGVGFGGNNTGRPGGIGDPASAAGTGGGDSTRQAAGGGTATKTGASAPGGYAGAGNQAGKGSNAAGGISGGQGGQGGAGSPGGQNGQGGQNGGGGATSGSFTAGSPSTGASGGGDSAGDPSGAASPSFSYSAGKRSPRRGQNWGLPDARVHSTAITRPIRVVVEPQRMVIMPERGEDRLPKQIPLTGKELTAQEVDQFVSAIQKHMQSWGLAVEGGYWKPLLKLEVAPNADDRERQIEAALQGSGFELQRKLR
jgi:hypothetical protein